MKRALILPLLAGMVWVCAASPIIYPFSSQAEVESILSIEESLLEDIFEIASPLFASEYGIEISPSALMSAYEDGNVTVTDLGDDHYRVSMGGHVIISTLGDQF